MSKLEEKQKRTNTAHGSTEILITFCMKEDAL